MTSIAQVFQYEHDTNVRTVDLDGQPWIVGKDICAAVGISKYRDALAQLDDDERESAAVDTPGGTQQMTLVNESGVYALLLISRSPKAKPFRKWVTSEVLPAIRKTGRYDVSERSINNPAVPQTFAQALRLAADLQERNEAQAVALEAAAPKVAYVDNFLRNEDACLLRQLAKRIGFKERDLREELLARRIIFRTPISRFSESKQREVVEYRYEPSTAYMGWFRECDQPNAPRHHNGQLRTTLYVTPAGKVGIARMLGRLDAGQPELEGASA